MRELNEDEKRVLKIIVNAAYEVHKEMGPGLLESVYEKCLTILLEKEGLSIERQKEIPVCFRGEVIEKGYRADIIVNNIILVELKCVEKVMPIHEAQIISYLKLSGLEVGLLINFHTAQFKHGVRRFINSK